MTIEEVNQLAQALHPDPRYDPKAGASYPLVRALVDVVNGFVAESVSGASAALLHIGASDRANVGSAETNVGGYGTASYELTADGDAHRASGAGLFANNGNNKQLRLYFNSTLILDTGALTNTGTGYWTLDAMCVRASSSTAKLSGRLHIKNASTTLFVATYDMGSLNWATGFGFALTGQGAASNDIVAKWEMGEILPAP